MDNLLIPEYRVEELVNSVKTILESSFSYVKVIGEISALKQASSGHYYFNLKENDSLINAVLFKGNLLNTKLSLEDGLEVVVYGKLTSYTARSNYQIIIESIRISGEGQLQKIINERKAKLEKEGLFDKSHKRIIKTPVRNVGIITSASGAAIKDIEIKLKDRLPINAFLFPSLVQGVEAEQSIIKGIEFFNKNYDYLDTIIVTRGGGSAEDLMCFNGEKLAYAVYNSKIPVISAVGHEIDWTIIDYVADLRLPTPTAVGEFLSPLKSECKNKLNYVFKKIIKNIARHLYILKYNLDDLFKEIKLSLINRYFDKVNSLKFLIIKLQKFDRSEILKQGYAIIKQNGKILMVNSVVDINSELEIHTYNKIIKAKILDVKEK